MASFLKSMEFGIKTYLKHGAFGGYNELKKSNFGDNVSPADAVALVVLIILAFTGFVLGWLAVPHLCKGIDTRSKNIRLGLYFILLVTQGQTGWLFALLWLMNVNVCV